MSKRSRTWNEAKYRKYLAEGRGQGTLADYKPWVQIQDFPSKGVVSRVKGRTTGRVHHLMSNLELRYFYLLDWSDKSADIREQFPLIEISDAIEIADRCGIRYPYDNVSGFPYVLTTDFLITTEDGYAARSVKPSTELSRPRVREKLEIERRYWRARGVDWRIVTENEISGTKSRNIEWLLSGSDFVELVPDREKIRDCEDFFISLYGDGDYTVIAAIRNVEKAYGLADGAGMALFKMLIRQKRIAVDLNRQICLTERGSGDGKWSGTYS